MKEKICGIYYIKNKINNKFYIGKSVNIIKRINEHKSYLNLNKHYNTYLQKSWNKYGEENFETGVIEECERNDLDYKEIFYIKDKNSLSPNGYNLTGGGGGLLYVIHSEESIKKMSLSKMGHIVTDETKKKISIANKNKPKNIPIEYIKELRKRWTGSNNPCYGKPMDEDRKRKMIETKRKNMKPPKVKKTRLEIKRENGKYSSNYIGVSYKKDKKKWKAYTFIHISPTRSKQKHMGYFELEVDAAKAYDKYIKDNDLNKPLNFPEDYK
jgi:group I intron endonuclease